MTFVIHHRGRLNRTVEYALVQYIFTINIHLYRKTRLARVH